MAAQRGRRSAASLAAVPTLPRQRREPPAELTPEQAAEWRKVTGSLPADWFSGESLALLADYCRHVVLGRRVAEQIDLLGPADLASEEGLRRFERLSAMLERHTRTTASLATRMRLTQQSRYGARGAGRAAAASDGGVAGARRPWEFEAGP